MEGSVSSRQCGDWRVRWLRLVGLMRDVGIAVGALRSKVG